MPACIFPNRDPRQSWETGWHPWYIFHWLQNHPLSSSSFCIISPSTYEKTHINIHSLNPMWRQTASLWYWFLSVTDTQKGGLSDTHESTYNTNGSARQSRLPSHLQRWSSSRGIETDWQDHTETCAVTAYPLRTQNIRPRFTSHKIFIHLHDRYTS